MACDLTEKLPPEVLARIFFFLDPLDKIEASSVCKRWMRIFNDTLYLLDDVCIHFQARNQTQLLRVFWAMHRNFSCFLFDGVIIDEYIVRFLQKFGEQCHSLCFENVDVTVDVRDPIYKISNLVNLLELRLLFSPVHKLFPYFPKLKRLHFQISDNFVQREFHDIAELTPMSLTDLRIDGLISTNHIGDSMNRLYVVLKNYIVSRRLTLRSLELTGLPISDENMANILNIEGLELKRLKLPQYFSEEDTFLALTTRQRGIVVLDLESVNVDDYDMVIICNGLLQLEELNVSKCALINKSVAQIFQLKCLRKLNLSGCRNIRNEALSNALGSVACKELRVLNLKYLIIDNYILSSLLSMLPNLKEITIDEGYVLGLDDLVA